MLEPQPYAGNNLSQFSLAKFTSISERTPPLNKMPSLDAETRPLDDRIKSLETNFRLVMPADQLVFCVTINRLHPVTFLAALITVE